MGVLEGAPGLRLKGLGECLLGVKQSFPGEQGFVGEAWVLKNNHPNSAAFRKVYLPLLSHPEAGHKARLCLVTSRPGSPDFPGCSAGEGRGGGSHKWGSSGPSPRVAQVTSAYIHPIDTDSLPWPQLQRSWDPWLSCVPREADGMPTITHYRGPVAGRGQRAGRRGLCGGAREPGMRGGCGMRPDGAPPRVRAPSSVCTGREAVPRAVAAAALKEPPEQRAFAMGPACAEGRRPPPPPAPRPGRPVRFCSLPLPQGARGVRPRRLGRRRLSAPCSLQGSGHGCGGAVDAERGAPCCAPVCCPGSVRPRLPPGRELRQRGDCHRLALVLPQGRPETARPRPLETFPRRPHGTGVSSERREGASLLRASSGGPVGSLLYFGGNPPCRDRQPCLPSSGSQRSHPGRASVCLWRLSLDLQLLL